MMDEEWGPWIEHDGKGCPCVGMLVESEDVVGQVQQHIAKGTVKEPGFEYVDSWNWQECNAALRPDWKIIRYRIRKPKALRELIDMVENLPVREDA
jgi:hypothetical protein